MQQIRHENVVKYVDAWTDSDQSPKFFSIVMEYCDGGDLRVISYATSTLFAHDVNLNDYSFYERLTQVRKYSRTSRN